MCIHIYVCIYICKHKFISSEHFCCYQVTINLYYMAMCYYSINFYVRARSPSPIRNIPLSFPVSSFLVLYIENIKK